MTDAAENLAGTPKRSSKRPLILAVFLAVAGAVAAFWVTQTGILPQNESSHIESAEPELDALPDVAYVPIKPMVISLGQGADMQHLRFAASIEVPAQHRNDVTTLTPRLLDMLNSYLRALELADLESSFALARIRAQILRRVQVVAGDGRVRDVLITEFVLK